MCGGGGGVDARYTGGLLSKQTAPVGRIDSTKLLVLSLNNNKNNDS